MIGIFTTLHVIVSLGIILIVLLQTSKGADFGGVFGVGGGGSGFFGGRGAGGFLSKVTTIMAIVFMVTSFFLSIIPSIRQPSILKSGAIEKVLEEDQTQSEEQAPETGQDSEPSN